MSERITQSVANMVTGKLMEKKNKEVDKALLEYQNAVKDAYKQSIPKAVMNLWKSDPDWVRGTNQIYVQGNGFNGTNVTFQGQLPEAQKNYNERSFRPEKEVAAELIGYKLKYEKLKEKRDNLQAELRGALLACVTYKKAIASFPEAKKYLPDTGLALVMNADKIIEELKDIPTTL